MHMMDASQISRSTVRTSIATIVAGEHEPHNPNCQKQIVIFSLRGAVRFAGSERLTRAVARELGPPNPDDPGSGMNGDVCAVVLALGDVYSLNTVAKRIIHEASESCLRTIVTGDKKLTNVEVNRLLTAGRSVVVVDPTGVLEWDVYNSEKPHHPHVFKNETEARNFIGGMGCKAMLMDNGW